MRPFDIAREQAADYTALITIASDIFNASMKTSNRMNHKTVDEDREHQRIGSKQRRAKKSCPKRKYNCK